MSKQNSFLTPHVLDTIQLGKETNYPQHYCPEVLFAIPRATTRTAYPDIEGITQGMDWWHVFEISWLNEYGIPQVAIGRLHIPADSEYLIESKSLKLYFNSFNFEKLSQQTFIQTVEKDLSQIAKSNIRLELFDLHQFPTHSIHGICIDHYPVQHIQFQQPNAQLLQLESSQHVEELLYSDVLRSNCPVTHQPDWATIMIRYLGNKINPASVLSYILSYRQHDGFHEQCVEQIFADIWQNLKPQKLMVYAAYTRRGGLDINPCRVSDLSWLPQPIRLARQ